MPVTGGKIYAELSQNLERISDGAEKHSKEANFPPSVRDSKLRDKRKKLEDLRQAYEDLLGRVRGAYDEYGAFAEDLQKEYSGHKTVLEGFYGKKSQVLSDFGLAPWKTGGKKGPRTRPPQ